jgi:propionyl-CoA carboxylase alpha chain
LTTAFIAEEFPDGFHGLALDADDRHRFVAAASAARLVRALRASGISGTMNGAYKIGSHFVVALDGQDFQVTNANLAAGNLHLSINGKSYSALTDWLPGQPIMYLSGADGEHAIQLTRVQGGYRLGQGGRTVTAIVRSPLGARLAAMMPVKLAPDTSKMLLCPMPGLVVSINVHEGQDVKAGEALAVVEAMKMENVLTAQADGTIKKINAAKGDSLAVDEIILEFA